MIWFIKWYHYYHLIHNMISLLSSDSWSEIIRLMICKYRAKRIIIAFPNYFHERSPSDILILSKHRTYYNRLEPHGLPSYFENFSEVPLKNKWVRLYKFRSITGKLFHQSFETIIRKYELSAEQCTEISSESYSYWYYSIGGSKKL